MNIEKNLDQIDFYMAEVDKALANKQKEQALMLVHVVNALTDELLASAKALLERTVNIKIKIERIKHEHPELDPNNRKEVNDGESGKQAQGSAECTQQKLLHDVQNPVLGETDTPKS